MPHGEEPGLELGEPGRLEPAGRSQLVHHRLERVEPLGVDLHLDPTQLHGPLSGPDNDHRVVESDLGGIDATHPQREGTPPGAHLEHLV